MKIILFGATGMIGQGVLRECLLDPQVTEVVSVLRRPSGQTHAKLREILQQDFQDLSPILGELSGAGACLFCLGVSSAGLTEAAYHHLTYDLTLGVATALAAGNPNLTFVYVSGAGTDSSEQGRIMWARVKGKTENALLRLPFKAVYLFRPGLIQPLNGITSSTRSYRILYRIMAPAFPILKRFWPDSFTTTEQLGRAMIRAGLNGPLKVVLETADLNRL